MGGWGQDWACNVVPASADVVSVGCVDLQPESLAQIQRRLNVPAAACFPTLEAALEATDADAVLVTAALPGHVPVALAALQAGKHALVEKPFAPSLPEAQAVVAAADAAERVLMISQNYRFYPAVRAVAALVREQPLGPVHSVSVEFRKYANTQPRGTNRHYEIAHPLLMDMSIHHFDLMRYVLAQEPTSVYCQAWNPPWSKFRDPVSAVATIDFDGGAVVSYRGSWVSTAPETTWSGAWRIECEQGEITWSARDDFTLNGDAVTLRPRGKRARNIALPAIAHWDRGGVLAAFVEAVRTGHAPETSGHDNLGSLALTFAAIASAESGQPQPISPLSAAPAAHERHPQQAANRGADDVAR
jgi:predicted dehydrogenase